MGLIPGAPTIYEVLEELAITVQQQLVDAPLPFCAFNGGGDVFVDVGNKSLGLEALMQYLKCKPHQVSACPAYTCPTSFQACSNSLLLCFGSARHAGSRLHQISCHCTYSCTISVLATSSECVSSLCTFVIIGSRHMLYQHSLLYRLLLNAASEYTTAWGTLWGNQRLTNCTL